MRLFLFSSRSLSASSLPSFSCGAAHAQTAAELGCGDRVAEQQHDGAVVNLMRSDTAIYNRLEETSEGSFSSVSTPISTIG